MRPSVPASYDALLLVSFGGPEGPDDVMPFLENVLRGRKVPRERMLEVAEHYHHFGGISPINSQNRALIAAIEAELQAHGPRLPVYFGNRNWHPLLPDTLRQMRTDGVKKAIAFSPPPSAPIRVAANIARTLLRLARRSVPTPLKSINYESFITTPAM